MVNFAIINAIEDGEVCRIVKQEFGEEVARSRTVEIAGFGAIPECPRESENIGFALWTVVAKIEWFHDCPIRLNMKSNSSAVKMH